MKPTLQLRLGQHLSLTPQLRQAIRLLQLSSVELEQEIQEALTSNPLLDDGDGEEAQAPSADTAADTDTTFNGEHTDTTGTNEDMVAEAGADDDDWYGESAFTASPGQDAGDWEREPADHRGEELHDHLLWQLHLSHLSERDRQIAVTLIDAIGEDGYLDATLEEIRASLQPEIDADIDEIEAVLHCIQHFDPLGAGARNLAECLLVQLGGLAADTPALDLARTLVRSHLDTLARGDRCALARSLAVEEDRLDDALGLIRSLDPKPGAQFSTSEVEYVMPDAYARRVRGVWQVSLNPATQPRLGINRHYAGLIAGANREDAGYLRGQLQEARWLIRSLEARNETLFKVASCIVERQQGFLEHGPEAMRPMILRDVAEAIGMHESTVSRITTRKYLHTPRGTFEFKYFFSSSVSTVDGGAASATAIQAMIRKLVQEEDSRKPLSDSAIASNLNQRGIAVARRTVAKYREAMSIPPSNERSRSG
ncbi:MAG TPA: RNA polymerase factor sigma-54 [Xanthomonadaceae bacterium]|nr:RNA polymerase factor sigma-54 [Xanthomonadaceae bacterium]